MIYAVCLSLLRFSAEASVLVGAGIAGVAFPALLLAKAKAARPRVKLPVDHLVKDRARGLAMYHEGRPVLGVAKGP